MPGAVPAHLEDQLLLPAGVLHRPLRRLLRTLRRDMRALLLKGKFSATRTQRYIYILNERVRAFPDCRPLAKDSVAKLKRIQQNVCTVYMNSSQPPASEICVRLAANYYQ